MADNSKLIQENLQAAREAVKAGRHRRAIGFFEECLRLARPRRGVKNNTIVYYHNSIAYSRLYLKQYVPMLESLVRAFSFLDLSQESGINALCWIFSNRDDVKRRLGAKAPRHAALLEKLKLPVGELERIIGSLLPAGKLKPSREGVSFRKLHGEKISDPYYFLEDPHNQSAKSWLDKERQRSQQAIQLLAERFGYPEEAIAAGWAQLHWLPSRFGPNYVCSELKLYSRHFLVRVSRSLKRKGRIVFDSEKVLKDNEDSAGTKFSLDGRWMLYGVSPDGSDKSYWRIRDIETGRDLPGQIDNVIWGNIYFSPDSKGVIFQKALESQPDLASGQSDGKKSGAHKGPQAMGEGVGYRAPTYYMPVEGKRPRLFHRPLNAASERSGVEPILNGKYFLFYEKSKGSQNWRVYLKQNKPMWQDLSRGRSDGAVPLELFPGEEGLYDFIGADGRNLLFFTRYRAPRGKVIAVEMDRSFTQVVSRKVILPQGRDNVVRVCCNNKNIVVVTIPLDEAGSRLAVYTMDGDEVSRPELPFAGYIGGVVIGADSDELFFSMSSEGRPTEHYLYDLKKGKMRLLYGATYKPDFDVVTKVVNVPSADGVLVPMFLSYRADLAKKPAPCLMSVYGGFNASLVPHFNYSSLCWMKSGGIWAQPCLRGDGLPGEDWHRQAVKLNKRRTFDDAYACARWLIDNKLTQRSLMAVSGASNGGLTVGALLTQYPRVFAAAIISNGLLDMMSFSEHSNGWSWISEYGSTANKKQFDNILSFSPYHQVNSRSSYPPIFFHVADCDDRVPPWHTYKFAAKLAASQKFRSILYVSSSQGHGSWRPSNLMLNKLMFLKFIFGAKNFADHFIKSRKTR